MLIKITRAIPKIGLEMLKKKGHKVEVFPEKRVMERSELLKFVKGADALITLLYDKVDKELIDAAGKKLKIIANFAVGFDNIDLKYARTKGILVTNTPHEMVSEAVAEQAFALMISLARRIVESDKFTRAGKYKEFDPELMVGESIDKKTLGIIGLGRIGAAVARRASKGFGMKVLYYDVKRNEEFEEMYAAKYEKTIGAVLSRADFVTLHVPLIPSTLHLINKVRFKQMKKNAYLINTSRGPVVSEKDLVAALKKKLIAGAGLDVYEYEPNISSELIGMQNVILTPHTASATIEARNAMAQVASQNIIETLAGKKPTNQV